jgi:hypothetical protein
LDILSPIKTYLTFIHFFNLNKRERPKIKMSRTLSPEILHQLKLCLPLDDSEYAKPVPVWTVEKRMREREKRVKDCYINDILGVSVEELDFELEEEPQLQEPNSPIGATEAIQKEEH